MNDRRDTTAQVLESVGIQPPASGLKTTALAVRQAAGHTVALPFAANLPSGNVVSRFVDRLRLEKDLAPVRKDVVAGLVQQAQLRVRTANDLALDMIVDEYQVRKAEHASRRSASAHALARNFEAQRIANEDELIEDRDRRIGQLLAWHNAGKLSQADFAARVQAVVDRYARYEHGNNQRTDHNLDAVARLVGGPSTASQPHQE